MAYTLEQHAVFEYRLNRVKKAFEKRKIRFYVPMALAISRDEEVTPQRLRNVMNAGLKNERALVVLETIAGLVPQNA